MAKPANPYAADGLRQGEGYRIPPELGSLDDLIARVDKGRQRIDPMISLYRDAYQYAIPNRDSFVSRAEGDDRFIEIYDATAPMAVQFFAARIHANMTPSWRQWAFLKPGTEMPADVVEDQDFKKNLELVNKRFFDFIDYSNFITQINEAYTDLAAGTGALLIQAAPAPDYVTFEAVPISEIIPEEGPRGTIETVWREHEVKGRNVQRLFAKAKLSAQTKTKIKKSPDAKMRIVEGTVYMPKTGDYCQLAFLRAEKELIWSQKSRTSPWVVFRWSVAPGELLGRGPILTVLPTIKTLNKVVEFTLRNAALAVAGMYTAVDDGVFNPYTMTIQPATVLPVRSNDQGNPSIRALERSGDFNVSQLIVGDMQMSIKQALFNSLRRADGPVKSATEVAIDDRELLETAGSSYGRIQTEGLAKIVSRVNDILSEAGQMPEIKIDGKEFGLQFSSPLARAQDLQEFQAMERYLATMKALGDETFLLNVKVEDLGPIIAEKLGAPATLGRSKDEKKQIEEGIIKMIASLRMQQQQQQPA